MVEVAERAAEAAWKIRNLDDFDARLGRAAGRVEDLVPEHREAAMVIYEAALMKSGRPREEVRGMVSRFRDAFEDDEEPLTIARTSGLMNVEGDEWFFGDGDLRVLTGRLLGQFQHRVAQYNYVDENEVLRRWADGYDTRLFIRRRVHETEPVVGVVGGFDLTLLQYLRVISSGDTLVPTADVARSLAALGYDEDTDEYETLARAESVALHLELPAPLAGEMLEELSREGFTDFPEPPRETEPAETESGKTAADGVATEGGAVSGGAAAEEREQKPSPEQRAGRRAAREDPARGEEPSRVQDAQAKDAPGVPQESGDKDEPAAPETGRGGEPGASDRRREET